MPDARAAALVLPAPMAADHIECQAGQPDEQNRLRLRDMRATSSFVGWHPSILCNHASRADRCDGGRRVCRRRCRGCRGPDWGGVDRATGGRETGADFDRRRLQPRTRAPRHFRTSRWVVGLAHANAQCRKLNQGQSLGRSCPPGRGRSCRLRQTHGAECRRGRHKCGRNQNQNGQKMASQPLPPSRPCNPIAVISRCS